MTFGKKDSHGYFPRLCDSTLAMQLETSGAVNIKGPKWCGKTSVGQRLAKSCVYLQDPDNRPSLMQLAELKPSLLLEGEKPRLIDEWQEAPQVWDAVRYAVDRGAKTNSFILTGSSTPRAQPKHSGVGRIAPMVMHTMTLLESGESSGRVSLASLFDCVADVGDISSFEIEDYAHAICRGGWPEAIANPNKSHPYAIATNYINELIDFGLQDVDGVRRNSVWMRLIMRSYARNISSQASLKTIASDMQGDAPSVDTVADYVDALTRSFVVSDIPAWNPRLRSKTAVRTSPTRSFCDPSIAAAVMRLTPAKLLSDFETFGLLFESLCAHDLRAYMSYLGGSVFHYRDKTGLEADAVVVLDDGRWAPVEIKMGESRVDEAAKNLLRLRDRVDTSHESEPSFMMVLTAGKAAYRREDGVVVCPLACLGA